MASSIDAYRIFYHVASCGSFTMAARILHNSQPNITRIIRQLEKELGCLLFSRSNKGVSLTREGELLFVHIREAMQHISFAEEELKSRVCLGTGQITIATSEAALHSVLLPALHDYRHDYPGVQVNVQSMSTQDALESLRHHLADFSVVTKPLSQESDLEMEELISLPDILIVPKDMAPSDQGSLTPEQIASWPFVSMHRGSVSFEMIRDYFARHELLFQPGTFVSSLSQILPMVSAGLGAAFLPEYMAQDALDSGTVFHVPLKEAPPSHTICLISQPNHPCTAPCNKLMERLRHSIS
jgi:DNA-binding transcriptional LysR family regulator